MSADRSIDERVQALEDLVSISRVMTDYHTVCDGWTEAGTHQDPEAIAALFTDDGVWADTAREPPPTGPIQIASMARELQVVPWIVHFAANPIVDIDGDRATAAFKGILRLKLRPDDRMIWAMGIYRLDAVRTPDGWRMTRMDWEPITANRRFDPADLRS